MSRQHDDHVAEYEREIIRRSDEYSPLVKQVMEHFWTKLDEVKAYEAEASKATKH